MLVGLWCTAGTAADDVWAVSHFPDIFDLVYVWHRTAAGWQDPPHTITDSRRAIFATSPMDVWVVGSGDLVTDAVHHYDGSWGQSSTSGYMSLYGVWASGPSDVWAVGPGGAPSQTPMHFDGTTWSQVGDVSGQSVWGAAPDDVWIVGNSGAAHWDGVAWSPEPGVPGAYAVHGSGPDDVWAVGAGGATLHRIGGVWSSVASGTTQSLQGVFSSSSSSAWAVGDGGTVLEWDGSAWAARDGATLADLVGVWVAPTGDVWAVGGNAIVHRAP